MSWRTYRRQRYLQTRRGHGDPSVEDAVALTPQGRLFHLPNGLTASAYFGFMLALSATGLMDRRNVRRLGIFLAWVSLSISGYLVYQLWFVLKRSCPLCMRAHTLNLALTLVLTAKVAGQEPRDR